MLTHLDLEARKQRRNDYQSKLTVTKNSAYSSGDVLGGLITIDTVAGVQGPIEEAGMSRLLQGMVVVDPDAQSPAMDLFFFNQKPAAVITDKTAFAPGAADMQNCIGVVHVANADYAAAGAGVTVAGGASQANLGHVLKPFAGTAIYCVVVLRATPTFANGGQSVRFQFA